MDSRLRGNDGARAFLDAGRQGAARGSDHSRPPRKVPQCAEYQAL